MNLRIYSFFIAISLLLFACEKNEEKHEKKIFRYNQAEGLSSLDPAFARNLANMWATNQIYNGLVELDKELKVVPCIAKSWTISEDGKVYTFKLNKGVKFHDSPVFKDGKGREVTAMDFVYSFKRILNPSTSSPGAWVFNDKILRDRHDLISDTCFKVIDNYTFRIYLKDAYPPFLQMLSMPYCFVIPLEAILKYNKDFRVHPVGTGPFKFKIWEEGSTLILQKNEKYWRQDENGKQLPYLDAIQISFLSDKNMSFLKFKKKKLDFISGIDESSREQILDNQGRVKKSFEDLFKVQKLLYLNTEYIGFQTDPSLYKDKKHPFLDKRVRKALNYAINREELVSYLRNNLGIPGTSGMVPYPMPSFDKNEVKGYDYDIEKALTLLAEAGYPGGRGLPEFELYTNTEYKEISEYLQKQWSKIGVKTSIQINQASTFIEMVNNGRVHFFRGSWVGDYPDAENYLSLFYSKNFAPSGPNKTHFVNKEFDKLYEKSQKVQNEGERFRIYRKMDQIIMDESPVIVLYYDELIRLMQKKVKGLEANSMNMLKLERVDFVEKH